MPVFNSKLCQVQTITDCKKNQELPAYQRPVSGPLSCNVYSQTSNRPLFNEFRTTKLLTKPFEKERTGIQQAHSHNVLGKRCLEGHNNLPVHKALFLSLACKKLPLMQCLTRPVKSVEEARERNRLGGYTQSEINAKRSAEEAAMAAYLEALERERENMFKLKRPERDINGRRILPPAHGEKQAQDVWKDDPLQVDMCAKFCIVCRCRCRCLSLSLSLSLPLSLSVSVLYLCLCSVS